MNIGAPHRQQLLVNQAQQRLAAGNLRRHTRLDAATHCRSRYAAYVRGCLS